MRTNALLWTVALALPFLAGCLSDGGPDGEALEPHSVAAADLVAGSAYAFPHVGGSLTIGLDGDGSAVAALYDPDDRRLGVLELGADAFRQDVRLEDLPAGSFVLQVGQLNGTLTIRSSGSPVATFQELGTHFERVPLVDRALQEDATMGLLPATGIQAGGEPVDLSTNLTLQRTPTLLRLYAAGSAQDAHVQVRGDAGTVLAYSGDYGTGGSSEPVLEPLGADFFPFNVRDDTFRVTVQAAAMDGALVLEAWSYSRAVPTPDVAASRVAVDDVPFTYGSVPSRPVLFQVHDRADALYVWSSIEDPRFADGWDGDDQDPSGNGTANGTSSSGQDDPEEGPSEGPTPWIVLFGPDDARLGAYPVPAGAVLRVPVDEGGDYVAVAKKGDVYLGADRAPINFQLSVLDVQETVFPGEAAGETARYGQRNGTADVVGVPYGARPTMAEAQQNNDPLALDGPFTGCSDPGTVRILQGGETVGHVRPGSGSDVERLDLHVEPGMTFVQDGLGGSCGHMAFAVMGYVR